MECSANVRLIISPLTALVSKAAQTMEDSAHVNDKKDQRKDKKNRLIIRGRVGVEIFTTQTSCASPREVAGQSGDRFVNKL